MTDSAGLSKILFGKVRRAILAMLLTHTDEAFYLRQIVRDSGYGLGPVQRELKLLSDAGIIRRSVRGRQVYFEANPDSPVFSELKSLIVKTAGLGDTLRDALLPLTSQIRISFVYGSMARGEEKRTSDVDILIIGDVSFSDVVVNLQAAQKTLGRDVNPTVYSVVELRSKLRKNHPFLTSVLMEPKIFLIGDDNELRRLAEKRLARLA